jgi:hypothetical protein
MAGRFSRLNQAQVALAHAGLPWRLRAGRINEKRCRCPLCPTRSVALGMEDIPLPQDGRQRTDAGIHGVNGHEGLFKVTDRDRRQFRGGGRETGRRHVRRCAGLDRTPVNGFGCTTGGSTAIRQCLKPESLPRGPRTGCHRRRLRRRFFNFMRERPAHHGEPAVPAEHRLADDEPGHQNQQNHQQADDQLFPIKACGLRVIGFACRPVHEGPACTMAFGDAVLAQGKGGEQGPVAGDVDQPGDAPGIFEDGAVGTRGERRAPGFREATWMRWRMYSRVSE